MDPLSVGSAVVGIIAACLHGTHMLVQDIERIRDVPEVLSTTKLQLQNVETVLQSLSVALGAESTLHADLRTLVQNAGVQNAVRACDSTCADFRTKLGKWTQHSTEDSLSWRDQFRIGMFKEARIQAFHRQMELCKSTIAMALGNANFIMISRSQPANSVRVTGLQTQERQVDTSGANMTRQIAEAESDIQQMQLQPAPPANSPSIPQNQDGELLEERQSELVMLRSYKMVSDEARSALQTERNRIRIEDVKVKDDGRNVLGMINATPESFANVDMSIKGVQAEDRGRNMVGCIQNFDVNAFMNG